MNHIIAYIQPFLAEQEIAVYADGVCVKTQKVGNIDDIAPVCYALSKEYSINQIDLAGAFGYVQRIKDDILTQGEFDSNELNVTIY